MGYQQDSNQNNLSVIRVKSGWQTTLSLSEESSVRTIFLAVLRYCGEKRKTGKILPGIDLHFCN